MPTDFEQLPRDAQKAFFAKLNAGKIGGGSGRGGGSGKGSTGEQRGGGRARDEEYEARVAADHKLDELMERYPSGTIGHLLRAAKKHLGTEGLNSMGCPEVRGRPQGAC
ncbi:hypothetical protein ACFL2Q_00930 [Thermodesulfobacteriota bacterium]